jgi:hypothetical protein
MGADPEPDKTRSTTTTATATRDLAAEIVQDVNRLVSLEVALAKEELKELAITNAIAAVSFILALELAVLAVLVAIPVLVVLLVPWHWQAALVWVLAYLLLAAGLALFGRSRLRISLPTRTIASLKETKAWALHRIRSNGR